MDDDFVLLKRVDGFKRLGYLRKGRAEALKLLNEVQYAFVVRQAERLRQWGDLEEMSLLRIEQVDEYWELKLKGNVLGKMNLRVFFTVEGENVVILGVVKKENEDETPRHIVLRMRNRRRRVVELLAQPAPKGSHK